jgi:hypothetical protein
MRTVTGIRVVICPMMLACSRTRRLQRTRRVMPRPACGVGVALMPVHGFPSAAAADVSDRSIDGNLIRGRLEHGVWGRRCWLMMRRKRRAPGETGIRRQRGWDSWIRGSHQALHIPSTHPSTMHSSPVHAAAGITGREPGEREHEGRCDEFSHIVLLAGVALKGFDGPVDAASGQ